MMYIVKKLNNFVCSCTSHVKFLDITNYLALGIYNKYLKAYKCTLTQGFFAYEWMADINKLNETCLQPHLAFYIKLPGSTISEEDYANCQQVWDDDLLRLPGVVQYPRCSALC